MCTQNCHLNFNSTHCAGGQDCVAANNNGNGEWDDDKCDDLKSFVCEKGTSIIYFKADARQVGKSQNYLFLPSMPSKNQKRFLP